MTRETISKRRREGAIPRFKASPVALGCAALLLTATTVVQAQAQAQPQTYETLVVTGIRASIESSIAAKKDASSIVETITAEDIGKLPDNSIAESIARLPGLAAQRVRGSASTVNIRGLSGDFAGTLFNGREQVSTGDNRAVEFDQYPAELLSGVTVYKTPDAGLIGQGLSGTIDMRTVRPLSVKGRKLALNLRNDSSSMGALNPDSSARGTRFSGTYIDQSDDGKMGWALGYAHLENPIQYKRWNAWGYDDVTVTPAGGVATPARALSGSEWKTYSGKNKRDSLMAVFEYKPSSAYSTLVDVYSSKFDEKITDRGLVMGIGLPWSGVTVTNPTVTNGMLSGGTLNGVKPVVWQEIQKRDDTIESLGWNNKFNMGNGWKAEVDLSHAKAKRRESIVESYGGAGGATDTFTMGTAPGAGYLGGRFGLNYADPASIKMMDTGGWGQDGYAKYLNVTDEINALRFNGSYDVKGAVVRSVDFGVNFTDRQKDKNVPESLVFLKCRTAGNTVGCQQPINSIGATPLLDVAGTGVAAWDVTSAYASSYNFVTKNHPDIYMKQWSVQEKVKTAFGKVNLDTDVGGGVQMRGNVGVQVVATNQASTALSVESGTGTTGIGSNISGMNLTAFTVGKSYTDVLPSANLAFELPNDQTMRVAYGKQIARARLDQLRASRTASVGANQKWDGNGGNPNLDPFRADALDISYEKYFGNKAYFGAALFHKKLKSFIYEQTITNYDFTGASNSSGIVPLSNIGTFKTPLNGKGGSVKGIELSASLPLNLLDPSLSGFGLTASYSLTNSNIAPQGPGSNMPLPGLSKHVSNLVAYYEKNGYSARIGMRKRSDFVGEIQGFGADRELVRVAPEQVVDLQFGYDVAQVKGLSLVLQLNNVTNAVYKEYYDTPDKPKSYQQYGRSVLFGANLKF